ncbi:MAG: hypothetical protein ACRDRT_17860 [Pseudonocardiaceae bacterium]
MHVTVSGAAVADTLIVDWGDGSSSSAQVAVNEGDQGFDFSHDYANGASDDSFSVIASGTTLGSSQTTTTANATTYSAC